MTDPAPLPVSAIVLAGGRSSRFGSDKLVARVGDSTLLDRSIAAAASIASEVMVVGAPGSARAAEVDRATIRFVEDPEPFGGPLVGLLAGLETVAEPISLVVGGDMPTMQPAVLELLVRTLVSTATVDAVVLREPGGIVPLPAALRTGAATAVARQLIGDGERRLRAVFGRLSTRVLEEGQWRPLDPAGETLRDVDVPDDLPPG